MLHIEKCSADIGEKILDESTWLGWPELTGTTIYKKYIYIDLQFRKPLSRKYVKIFLLEKKS